MFGRLPTLHRWTVAVSVVLVFSWIGVYLGTSPQVPVLVPGATAGALAVGALVAWLLVGHGEGHGRR